jgi:chaperonin cofactor prefoldin
MGKPSKPSAKSSRKIGTDDGDSPSDYGATPDKTNGSFKRKEITPNKDQPNLKNPKSDEIDSFTLDPDSGSTDDIREMDVKIESLIKRYLKKATEQIIAKISESSTTLKEHSKKLDEIFLQTTDLIIQIDDLKPRVDATEMKMNEFENSNQETMDRIKEIQSCLYDYEAKLKNGIENFEKLCRKNRCISEEQEQYGRRNALRINNVPLAEIPKKGGSYDTDSYIVELANNALHIDLSHMAISRSHIVGRIDKTRGVCQLIVKFTRYNTRQLIFASKSKLKDHPGNVYVTEDLTPQRYQLIGKLNKLRKEDKIHAFWTQDGRVFVKSAEDSAKLCIQNVFIEDASEVLDFVKNGRK